MRKNFTHDFSIVAEHKLKKYEAVREVFIIEAALLQQQ
jgi:hypothetical protein